MVAWKKECFACDSIENHNIGVVEQLLHERCHFFDKKKYFYYSNAITEEKVVSLILRDSNSQPLCCKADIFKSKC